MQLQIWSQDIIMFSAIVYLEHKLFQNQEYICKPAAVLSA